MVKVLEEEFGVIVVVLVVVVVVLVVGVQVVVLVVEEKIEFNVILVDVGSDKIKVIKVVREIIGFGLKEVKDFVDGVLKLIKENVLKEEVEQIKKKFEEVGVKVEFK